MNNFYDDSEALLFPLSSAQRRLWTLAEINEADVSYNIPFALRCRGKFHYQALRQALTDLQQRHEILRTSYGLIDDSPMQRIHPAEDDLALPLIRINEAQLEKKLAEDAAEPFNLQLAPVFHARVYQLNDDHHILSMVVHHIACDGWSVAILLRELSHFYNARVANMSPTLAELPLQYADYAEWEEAEAKRTANPAGETGTRPHLQPAVALPGCESDEADKENACGIVQQRFDADFLQKLNGYAREHHTTLFVTLLAGFMALLRRLTQADDVCIGFPVANRKRSELENIVGYFVNTLVIRDEISRDDTFDSLVARCASSVLDALEHEEASYEKLLKQTPRENTNSVPFTAMFAFENISATEFAFNDLQTELVDVYPAQAKFDLTLLLKQDGEVLTATFEFRRERILPEIARSWMACYQRLLEAEVLAPAKAIDRVKLADVLIKPFTSPTIATDLCTQFEAAASRHADRVAITCEGESLTYAALDSAASALAWHLRGLGVGTGPHESLVGLSAGRGPGLLVGILGILKAGGAYVPLDPVYPAERLAFLAADSGIRLAVADDTGLAALAGLGVQTVSLSADHPRRAGNQAPPRSLHPQQAAYVIYTSGSTGQPKGCVVSHASVVRLFTATEHYGFGESDVWTLFHSYAFDFSVWEIWGALLHGGRLVVVPYLSSRDPERFAHLLEAESVTVLSQTPAAFRQLTAASAGRDFAALRLVLFGGEALEPGSLAPWFAQHGGRVRLVNMYGITETTVHVTEYTLTPESMTQGSVIGTALADLHVQVLDRYGEPVPAGVTGEMYVGGAGVTRGYLGRAALTAQRFVPDPFGAPGARLYRSGDLARRRADGGLVYQGRADQQLKLRGYRIEPGEIEAALRAQAGVRDAAVVLDAPAQGQPRLVAYVVGGKGAQALREALSAALPEHMVPAVIMPLARLPLTAHGKLDRKALPEPEVTVSAGGEARTEVEKTLAGIWSEVLSIPVPGIDDNFFTLGGDSISSLQVVSKARAAGIAITPKQALLFTTLRKLAAVAETSKGNAALHQNARCPSGPLLPTPIIAWFQALKLSAPAHWNQSLALEIAHPVAPDLLAQALKAIGQHHDAFRLRLDYGNAESLSLAEVMQEPFPLEIRTVNSQVERDAAILHAQKGLSLDDGPVGRAMLIQHAGETDILVLVIHHIAVDAVSWHILLDDLNVAIKRLQNAQKIVLDPVVTNLTDWSRSLQTAAERADPQRWLRMAAQGNPSPFHDFVTVQGLNREQGLTVCSRTLSSENSALFLQLLSRGSEARASALLCAALWRLFNEQPLAVTLEHNGRDVDKDADLSRTLGWFTSLYPFFYSGQPALASAELLAEMESSLLELAPHKAEYGLVRWLSEDEEVRAKLDEADLPALSLNYLGQIPDQQEGEFVLRHDISSVDRAVGNVRAFTLDLVAVVINGELRFYWNYCRNVLKPEIVEGWADALQQHLQQLLTELTARPLLVADFPLARIRQIQFEALVGKQAVADAYPLSPLQEGMLFHSVAEPENHAYHEQAVALFERLDADLFIKAWKTLLSRHDILRTSFHWQDLPRPLQIVHATADLPVTVFDWRGEDPAERLAEFLQQDADKAFDLSVAPLLRVMLARIDHNSWRWVCSYHHILMDGWSLPLLMGELVHIYESLVAATQPTLPPPVQYGRHIARLVQHASEQTGKVFWLNALAGLERPTLLSPQQQPSADYHDLLVTLSPEQEQAIRTAAREAGVSLGNVFNAAWGILLALSGHGNDVVFGSTLSGRETGVEDVDKMIGLFINTLPLRLRLRPEMSVRDLLHKARQFQADLQEHSHDRLVDVQRWSGLEGEGTLFDSVLVIENYPGGAPEDNGKGFRLVEFAYKEHSNYPVTLAVLPDNGLKIKLDYNCATFDDTAAALLLKRLTDLISKMIEDPDRRLSTLDLLAEEEQIIAREVWNAGAFNAASPVLAHQMFEKSVSRQPQAPALLQGETKYDYSQLNHKADALAATLQQQGVGPESVVAVMLSRGPEAVISFLAILKAGGVYLPLDAQYPVDRLDYMLRDSQAVMLLSDKAQSVEKLTAMPKALLLLDSFDFTSDACPAACTKLTANNLAYLIYTSGSTGKPKPVGVSHAGIANLQAETERMLGTDAHARVYMQAPLSFDASVWEMMMALFGGGALVLPDGDAEGDVLAALNQAAERHHFTHVLVTPALLGLMKDYALPSLHTLIVGGDASAPGMMAHWAKSRRVFNAYGPSECTVCVAIEPCDVNTVTPPLGLPLYGIPMYLLDSWGNPVPPGVIGEIFLGGDSLARGYIGRPALTAGVFIPDHLSGLPGARLYRTGDTAIRLPDGRIKYGGRTGGYAKLRGNRIDLNGVELLLQGHPAVREALAMIRTVENGQSLIAWVVAEKGTEADELRDYMVKHAAAFEVPGAIVPLTRWPLTPAGKIDRNALPLPATAPRASVDGKALRPAEAALLQIWSQALGRDDIDLHDDYFSLGGDSIIALQITSLARQEGWSVTPRMVLQYRTVAALAAMASMLDTHEPEPDNAKVELAPIQHWYFAQNLPAVAHWNLSIRLELQSRMVPQLLQQALNELVKLHPALRLRFEHVDGVWQQHYSDAATIPLELLPESHQKAADREAGLQSLLNLSTGPLLRAAYRDAGETNQPELVLIAHHLIMDTWSLRILVEDLASLYISLQSGTPLRVLQEGTSYRQWSQWLTQHAADFTAQTSYWRNMLDAGTPPVAMPRKGCVGDRQVIFAELDRETSDLLTGDAHQAYHSRGQELLLTALAQAWHRWCGNTHLAIELETHGREAFQDAAMDLSRSVGWFTALFPLCIAAGSDWANTVDNVKQTLRHIPSGGHGYGILRYLLKTPDICKLTPPSISFNYLGDTAMSASSGMAIQLSRREAGPGQAAYQLLPHALNVTVMLVAGRLRLSLAYADTSADTAMQTLLNHYQHALHDLAEHCRLAEPVDLQSSDVSGVQLSDSELSAILSDLTEDDQ
ncbi:non-ribosomal peptide synthetase [Pantoea agglomerans]|uniref:non-ribosomal peptide synthetase n=2 Tax=Enterobacter agglomerans TaxID=549 RepID=UPI002542FDC7|nr:non-ribosomal peptide synthetase [Pantoea agglomerans]MDK4218997.1 amino acid adenylation domain-containing protein [Pantoea agglomerans]